MEYPKFKVCVRCFTFNQAKYIEDTMNGFVMQQTDFPFVCCIVDDASTDGEQKVIKKYMDMHFDYSPTSVSFEKETDYAYIHYAQHKENKNCYFAVVFLKMNLYSKKEGFKKFEYISKWRDICEYEAICEGDDYWLISDKLQKQADFLDKHNDYGMVYSKCYVLEDKANNFKQIIGGDKVLFDDLILKNCIPTLTSCIRLKIINKFYAEKSLWNTQGWKLGDYPIWLWTSLFTKIHFLDEIVGVYRVLPNSASHSDNPYTLAKFQDSVLEIQIFFINKFRCGDIRLLKYVKQDLRFVKALLFIRNGFLKDAAKNIRGLSFYQFFRCLISCLKYFYRIVIV